MSVLVPVDDYAAEVISMSLILGLQTSGGVLPHFMSDKQQVTFNPSRLDESVAASVKNDSEFLKDNLDLKERIADATLSYTTHWPKEDAKVFNQKVFRTLHPESFFTHNKAYRWIVTAGDEDFRLKVFGGAALVFAISLFSVDMNRTSLHRFYRNRISHAFLSPDGPSRLSDLDTTNYGAPYQLINTTLELSRPRFLDDVDDECMKPDAERRDRQLFLFSQEYCGASATGWIPTIKYQNYLKENITLGDAMALSGAASDAMLANSLSITFFVTALNLTLGQWMSNPMKPKKSWPWNHARAGVVLRDWSRPIEESDYCFICDGGFTDNLGVLPLLKRRCKVIIALDAGCDSKQEFADLGVVLRAAHIQEGISFYEVSGQNLPLNTIDLALDKRGICPSHFVVAKIAYPAKPAQPATADRPALPAQPASYGWFVYLKPSFTNDEGCALLAYRRQNPEFPYDTTADQFYDATRFESYRELGAHLAASLCNELRLHPGMCLDARLAAIATGLASRPEAPPPINASLQQISKGVGLATAKLGEISDFRGCLVNSAQGLIQNLNTIAQSLTRAESTAALANQFAGIEQQLKEIKQTFVSSKPAVQLPDRLIELVQSTLEQLDDFTKLLTEASAKMPPDFSEIVIHLTRAKESAMALKTQLKVVEHNFEESTQSSPAMSDSMKEMVVGLKVIADKLDDGLPPGGGGPPADSSGGSRPRRRK